MNNNKKIENSNLDHFKFLPSTYYQKRKQFFDESKSSGSVIHKRNLGDGYYSPPKYNKYPVIPIKLNIPKIEVCCFSYYNHC
jgi:hypothetical protein